MNSKAITDNLISFYSIIPGLTIRNDKFAGLIRNCQDIENTLMLSLHITFDVEDDFSDIKPINPPNGLLKKFGITEKDLLLQM